MNDAERFLQRCRLTCLGGSERGTCPCSRPDECEERNHPDFAKHRAEASTRLLRKTTRSINEETALFELRALVANLEATELRLHKLGYVEQAKSVYTARLFVSETLRSLRDR